MATVGNNWQRSLGRFSHRSHSPGHRSRSSSHIGRLNGRRSLLWLLTPLLIIPAVAAILYAHTQTAAATATAPPYTIASDTALRLPADRFVQSIVKDDGALGWHQLCPSVQAALPLDQLVQQADAARAAAAQQGIKLSAEFVDTHPQQDGGEQRLYMVTAHWPNGGTMHRTFAVVTQPTGCVEDAGYQ